MTLRFKAGRTSGGSPCLHAETTWTRRTNGTVAVEIRALAFDGAMHYSCTIQMSGSWHPLGEASWEPSAQGSLDQAWAALRGDYGEIGGRLGRALQRLPRRVTKAQEARLARAEVRDDRKQRQLDRERRKRGRGSRRRAGWHRGPGGRRRYWDPVG